MSKKVYLTISIVASFFLAFFSTGLIYKPVKSYLYSVLKICRLETSPNPLWGTSDARGVTPVIMQDNCSGFMVLLSVILWIGLTILWSLVANRLLRNILKL